MEEDYYSYVSRRLINVSRLLNTADGDHMQHIFLHEMSHRYVCSVEIIFPAGNVSLTRTVVS